MSHTPNISCACFSPAWQSWSNLFISWLRKKCLILFPCCCASTNVYILWSVLFMNFVNKFIWRKLNIAYSRNFPMLSTSNGGRDPTVSDFIWSSTTAYRMWWMFSMSWAHSFLFCFTFYDSWAVTMQRFMKYTWTKLIKLWIVFTMGWTNGGPNASLSSLRSGRASVKHVVIWSRWALASVSWRGIVEVGIKLELCCLYVASLGCIRIFSCMGNMRPPIYHPSNSTAKSFCPHLSFPHLHWYNILHSSRSLINFVYLLQHHLHAITGIDINACILVFQYRLLTPWLGVLYKCSNYQPCHLYSCLHM